MSRLESPARAPLVAPHALSAANVLSQLASDCRRGLSTDQVRDAQARHGANELGTAPPAPWWRKLLGQFRELVIWILIVAALIAGAMGEWVDTVAILAIVLLNGILGFVQEEKAQKALEALQKLSHPMAKAVRDGALQTIAARDLVPGDIIELEAGDNVPADARLIEAFGLRVQEAALTGESVPVEKVPQEVLAEAMPLGDRRNMAYLGTVVAAGKACAAVTGTGMRTELGRIAGLLMRHAPEPTPLQRRLAELGKVLVVVCLVLVTVIFVLQMARGGELLPVLMLSVSLAVAAVPEGLPAVVTLALALGLQRMVKRNALVRKLPSVETLGSVTVICSDKTGTLTKNEMTVRVVIAGDDWYDVTGAGYAPRGQFHRKILRVASGDPITTAETAQTAATGGPAIDPQSDPHLKLALVVGVRCNNATVSPGADGDAAWQVVGDPTEGALIVAALKAGIDTGPGRPVFELPFDSDRKAMSVVWQAEGFPAVMYTKGAPEAILARCTAERRGGAVVPLSEERRRQIAMLNTQLASQAWASRAPT